MDGAARTAGAMGAAAAVAPAKIQQHSESSAGDRASNSAAQDSDSAIQQVSAGDQASDSAARDSDSAMQRFSAGDRASNSVIQRFSTGGRASDSAGTASADKGGWRFDRCPRPGRS